MIIISILYFSIMQAQHTDREKAVPMFNAFQRRVPDDISRWLAKVSENPIVEAFPEKIDIHPGMDSSMLLPTEMPEVLSELVSKPRTRRTVAYINVPYCETRCLYCLFYIKPYRNKEESNAFADTLIKELQSSCRSMDSTKLQTSQKTREPVGKG